MDEWVVSRKICLNCGNKLCGIRDAKGLVKMKCDKCGLSLVSKYMSRRHERVDVYIPEGNVFNVQ